MNILPKVLFVLLTRELEEIDRKFDRIMSYQLELYEGVGLGVYITFLEKIPAEIRDAFSEMLEEKYEH